jgi:hypothetical protein
MSIQTVTRRWRLGPSVSVLVLVALLLVALGARLWDSIPDKLYLAVRGDPSVVEQVLPRAQAGDPEAQHDLGLRYAGGRGVPKDPERAVRWYRAAAEQGYGPAQSSLALAYYWGTGVARDRAKAADWYRRAAEHDMAGAGYMLGLIYWSGEGVAKDMARAAHWHGQAAEHGNHYAQQFLAALYRDGRGVARDQVQAYKWLDLAIPGLKASPARDSWIEMREQLGETMTAEEIAEARRLAREWTPKIQ